MDGPLRATDEGIGGEARTDTCNLPEREARGSSPSRPANYRWVSECGGGHTSVKAMLDRAATFRFVLREEAG